MRSSWYGGLAEFERWLMGEPNGCDVASEALDPFDAPGRWCVTCGRSTRREIDGRFTRCDGCMLAELRGVRDGRGGRDMAIGDEISINHSPLQDPWPLIRLGEHRGDLRRAVLRIKHEGSPELAGHLGRALGRQWRATMQSAGTAGAACEASFDGAVVQPVPMPWLRRVERGHDHARELAEGFAAETTWRLVSLLRQKWRGPQARLVGVARRTASAPGEAVVGSPGRFAPRERAARLGAGPVILVDDVRTTGSTLLEASRVLLELGFAPIGAVVLAVSHDNN